MGECRKFVLLEHDYPHLHWDFLIEDGDALASWRLQAPPEPDRMIDAVPLPRHRRDYLTYEGPVSGNRGTVKRLDAGELCVDDVWPPAGQWADRLLTVRGGLRFRQCRLLANDTGTRWIFH